MNLAGVSKLPPRLGIIAVLIALVLLGTAVLLLRGPSDGAVAAQVAQADWYTKCSGCSAERRVTAAEIGKLFPPVGLAQAAEPPQCPKCGKRALRPALKCPKDGTVFPIPAGEDAAVVSCPKCGWTLQGEHRKP